MDNPLDASGSPLSTEESPPFAYSGGGDFPYEEGIAEEGLYPEGGPWGRGRGQGLSLGQQAALWHALLLEWEGRLKEGHMGVEELGWLQEKLERLWGGLEKEGLPTALNLRMQAFLEALEAQAPPPTPEVVWPLWPVEFSSRFGYRKHPLTGERRFHQGVDLRATAREEVRSIQGGWVLHAGWAGGYGYMVEVLHSDNSLSRYAHLSQVNVRLGQKLETGTVVGLAGNSGNATGVHVHFELWKEGSPVNPLLHLPPLHMEKAHGVVFSRLPP